jgi:hypothetical protein
VGAGVGPELGEEVGEGSPLDCDGIDVTGTGEDVGSTVNRSSLPVGLDVLAGDVLGTRMSRSRSNCDGIDVTVTVDTGDNVGSTVIRLLFSVGLEVVAVPGKDDGAGVSPSVPNSEGLGVDAGEDDGSTVYFSSFSVGPEVLN